MPDSTDLCGINLQTFVDQQVRCTHPLTIKPAIHKVAGFRYFLPEYMTFVVFESRPRHRAPAPRLGGWGTPVLAPTAQVTFDASNTVQMVLVQPALAEVPLVSSFPCAIAKGVI